MALEVCGHTPEPMCSQHDGLASDRTTRLPSFVSMKFAWLAWHIGDAFREPLASCEDGCQFSDVKAPSVAIIGSTLTARAP